MNRLQKKCLIASAAVHALLLLILLFGAALMPEAKPKDAPSTPIHVFDPNLVSMTLATHGGNPDAQAASQAAPTPPAAPNPPAPMAQPPQPRAVSEPATPPEIPKAAPPKKSFLQSFFEPAARPAPAEPDDEPAPPPKKHTVVIDKSSLTPVKRTAKKTPVHEQPDEESDSREQAREQAREAAAARRRAREISQTTSELSQRLSSDTHIDSNSNPGVGGGGPAMANYWDIMASEYLAAWSPPASLEDELATVTVYVSIGRDGMVKNARITKSSGNAAMDQSIRLLLDNKTVFPPFPPDSEAQEKTHYFRFNLSAKRSLG